MEIHLTALIRAIAGFATPIAKNQANRNEAVIKLKQQFHLDSEHIPDEFDVVYAYTLVEYGVGKQQTVLELFRQTEIKQAFRRAFEQDDLSILQSEGENFLDWHILGDEVRELEINPRREFAAFTVVFYEMLPRTRRPSQVMQDRQLHEILEQLHNLNTLDEIRELLIELLQSHHSHPNNLQQQSVNFLEQRLEETVNLYLTKSFNEDKFAELDQAGETDPERRTPLKQVFIDLDVKFRQGSKPRELRLENLDPSLGRVSSSDTFSDFEVSENFSVMDCLLKECCSKSVVIGGSGQGKSTLGQQLAQVHRAKLLGQTYDFEPLTERIPFRVVLKYFAQWLADKPNSDDDYLEAYLAEKVGKLAARAGSVSSEDIQEILRCRACALILDGLDEVVVPELQKRMLARVEDFLQRAEILGANLIVVATSRPNVYENQFEPEQYWHLELQRLSPEKVCTYAEKWVRAKNLSEEEQKRIILTLEECQQDGNISALLTTPLQVTIILLIIKDGGRPPSQREALFNEYWTTIFRREKSKAKGILQNDETILFELHANLGYLLHRRVFEQNVQALLSEKELSQAVREFLRKEDRFSPEEVINSKVKLLVRDAEERLVLIVSPQPKLFGFELRSFQEFFAAVHLAQTAKDTEQRFARLKEIAYFQHCANVALFFAARIARISRAEASNILELVCRPMDRGEPNRYLKPGAWFALEIAADGALSNNRNLQYNAIEYGLEVLDTGLAEGQREEITSLTMRFSEEDRRDIFRPVLEEKLNSLPVSCLENAAILYSKHFEATQLLQQKIELLFQSRQENAVISAFALGLQYQLEPAWIVECLQIYWSYLTKDRSNVQLNLLLDSSQYFEKLLSIWQPSESEAIEIAKVIYFSEQFHQYWQSEQELEWDVFQPKTISEQLILLLRCKQMLSWLEQQLPWHKQVISLPAIGVEMRGHQPSSLVSVSHEIVEALNSLLQNSELLLWLRLKLWMLFWYTNEPTFSNVSDFITTINFSKQTLSKYEQAWLKAELLQRKPLLDIAVKKQQAEGNDGIKRLLPFLNNNTQISVAKQVFDAVQEYVVRADANQQKHFYIALEIQHGLDKLFPQLVNVANEMSITVEELVAAHINVYGYQISHQRQTQYSFEELQHIIAFCEASIEEDREIMQIRWLLTQIEIPTESKIIQQIHQFFNKLIDYKLSSPHLQIDDIIIIVFTKLVANYPQAQEIASRLFTTISLTRFINFSHFLLYEIFGNLSPKFFDTLISLLTHEQEDVQLGSALILKAYLDSPTKFKYRDFNTDEIEKLGSFHFDVEMAWSLTNSNDKERRLIGITLLSLSDYPIEEINYRHSLLKRLQYAEDEEEQKAWIKFLAETSIADSKPVEWRNLLEEILNKPWNYSNLVLSTAMQRYQMLTTRSNSTISEAREKELGLL